MLREGDQRVIREVIRGHQRGHQRSSEVIRGHQRSSEGFSPEHVNMTAPRSSSRSRSMRSATWRSFACTSRLHASASSAYLWGTGGRRDEHLHARRACMFRRRQAHHHQSATGNQRPSEAIRGHQRLSEAMRGHQRPSEAIRARTGASPQSATARCSCARRCHSDGVGGSECSGRRESDRAGAACT